MGARAPVAGADREDFIHAVLERSPALLRSSSPPPSTALIWALDAGHSHLAPLRTAAVAQHYLAGLERTVLRKKTLNRDTPKSAFARCGSKPIDSISSQEWLPVLNRNAATARGRVTDEVVATKVASQAET